MVAATLKSKMLCKTRRNNSVITDSVCRSLSFKKKYIKLHLISRLVTMGWEEGVVRALSQSMRPGNQFHCKEQIRSKHPTMAEKEFFSFFFWQKRGFSHFVLHVKRRR